MKERRTAHRPDLSIAEHSRGGNTDLVSDHLGVVIRGTKEAFTSAVAAKDKSRCRTWCGTETRHTPKRLTQVVACGRGVTYVETKRLTDAHILTHIHGASIGIPPVYSANEEVATLILGFVLINHETRKEGLTDESPFLLIEVVNNTVNLVECDSAGELGDDRSAACGDDHVRSDRRAALGDDGDERCAGECHSHGTIEADVAIAEQNVLTGASAARCQSARRWVATRRGCTRPASRRQGT